MKVLIFAFVITYISAINSFEIQKIEGVEGYAYDVIFDSKFNSYVDATGPDDYDVERLYKLDPQNNVVFVMEFINISLSMRLNDKDELYLFSYSYDDIFTFNISIIRVNSSELEHIATVDMGTFLVDNDGNLVYYSVNDGIVFLKYNTTDPVTVKNLEHFLWAENPFVTDSNGNTYLAGLDLDVFENQLVVIPGDSKEGTPEGFIVEGVLNTNDYVEQIAINSNDELLISVSNIENISSVKKLVNGTVTTIYANENYNSYYIYTSEKRTIITADDSLNGTGRVTVLSPDGESVEISNSRNETWSSEFKSISIDEEGSAFIEWSTEEEEYSQFEFLNYTETKSVEVDLGDDIFIYYSMFDGNNNLWVKTLYQTYFLRKGSLELELVPNATDLINIFVNKKQSTEIYMSSWDGLYIVSN